MLPCCLAGFGTSSHHTCETWTSSEEKGGGYQAATSEEDQDLLERHRHNLACLSEDSCEAGFSHQHIMDIYRSYYNSQFTSAHAHLTYTIIIHGDPWWPAHQYDLMWSHQGARVSHGQTWPNMAKPFCSVCMCLYVFVCAIKCNEGPIYPNMIS